MGGVGVRAAVAQALVAAGMVLVAVAAWLLLGAAFALLVAGVLLAAYGLLLVNVPVPEQAEQAAVAGPEGTVRVGR